MEILKDAEVSQDGDYERVVSKVIDTYTEQNLPSTLRTGMASPVGLNEVQCLSLRSTLCAPKTPESWSFFQKRVNVVEDDADEQFQEQLGENEVEMRQDEDSVQEVQSSSRTRSSGGRLIRSSSRLQLSLFVS